jgi:hypothetical protein
VKTINFLLGVDHNFVKGRARHRVACTRPTYASPMELE